MTTGSEAASGSWRADPNSEISEQLRRKILGAARDCLVEVGHDKLRMGMVARQAGCSRATIYRYFSSKEEILLNIAVENFQRINDEVDREISRISDIRLKLATGLARSLAMARPGDMTHLFTAEMLGRAMSERSEGLAALATHRIGPIYSAAQRQGWVRDGVELEDAVNWVILASTGLLNMGWPVVGERELDAGEQVQYLCRYLFYPIFEMDDLLP